MSGSSLGEIASLTPERIGQSFKKRKKKATVTQMTTAYSEVFGRVYLNAQRKTLKQTGYSYRRPHWVPQFPVHKEQETYWLTKIAQ